MALVFAAAANGDISESAPFSPVAFTGFAEMARLCSVVVIVVAEFGVG